MKTLKFTIILVYIGIAFCGSLWGQVRDAVGSDSILLGGKSGWNFAETKSGIAELQGVRSNTVLALSSAAASSVSNYTAALDVWGLFSPLTEPAQDLSISFDENSSLHFKDFTRRYKVVSLGAENAARVYARAGSGAALFNNNGHIIVQPQDRDALFWQGNRIGDFTIEFWLYPFNMENGEEILVWTATGKDKPQKINSFVSRNRLTWSFINFFTSIDEKSFLNLELSGRTVINPKTWSHHLIRFDASTGLLEYVVNGESEAITYATSTGSENINSNSGVFAPVAGSEGFFTLGGRFTGILDEVKIHEVFAGRSSIRKYPSYGGRMETRVIDLGHNNSSVVKVDASGGRVSLNGKTINNEYKENGRFRFSCDAEMSFYIRSGDNPYLLHESPWHLFTPGADLSGAKGRFIQIAVDLFPSKGGETSPYLDALRIVYLPGEPPLPPQNLRAVAVDGGVMLRWRSSPDINTKGYLVYYGTGNGELFGKDALQGASPINVGNRNSILIDGLKNGTLYYFRVTAYDEHSTGEFSSEVTARPIAGLSISEIMLEQ